MKVYNELFGCSHCTSPAISKEMLVSFFFFLTVIYLIFLKVIKCIKKVKREQNPNSQEVYIEK